MRRSRARKHLLVLAASLVVLYQQPVAGWSIKQWPTLNPAKAIFSSSHHEDLAERAARCMPSAKIPLPGCRRNYVVNPAFFVGEVRRGAVEPDLDPPLGDGVDSSRHSLNPRFNRDAVAVPIFQAYGFPRDVLGEGLAPNAIDELKTRIKTSIAAISCSSTPTTDALQLLWGDMGRLSHYVADVNSPFHPNSFRADEGIPNKDYHW